MGGSARPPSVGILLLGLTACSAGPEVIPPPFGPTTGLDAEAQAWVDETLARLSIEELAGQLVIEWIPGGYVSPSSPDFEPLRRWVVDAHLAVPNLYFWHFLVLLYVKNFLFTIFAGRSS